MVAPRTRLTPSDKAVCGECPLATKQCRIVPTYRCSDAQAVIVLDHPHERNLAYRKHLIGQIGSTFRAKLRAEGIERYSLVYRLSCPPSIQHTNDRSLRAAAKACDKRFRAELSEVSQEHKLPILCCGKYAASWLRQVKLPLRSGHVATIKHAALAKEIPFDGVVYLDSPRQAFWSRPATQVPFLAGLSRFARLVHGVPLPPPVVPMIYPTTEMLGAIRSMGPEIAWDLETLGVDPMHDKITAVGISDGRHTISVPWDNYTTKTEGAIRGIAQSRDPLHVQIKQAVLDVLESKRLQITQNGNYDVVGGKANGLKGRNDWDIMLAHAVLYPEILHNLEAISVQCVPGLRLRWKSAFRAGRSDDSREGSAYVSANQIDLRDYNGYDCWSTFQSKQTLDAELAVED